MRYRRGWNGMTEIVWDEVMEGNTVRDPQKQEKVIQMENIRPRKAMRQRQAAGKHSGRRKWIIRKKELLLISLSIQAAAMHPGGCHDGCHDHDLHAGCGKHAADCHPDASDSGMHGS